MDDDNLTPVQSAKLCLNTHDIRAYTNREAYFNNSSPIILSTAIGQIGVAVCECTWTQLSLKDILGSLYRPNGLYSIELVQFQTIPYLLGSDSASFPNFINNGGNTNLQSFVMYLTGLNWVESAYDIKQKCSQTRAQLCPFYITEDRDLDANFENADQAGLPDIIGNHRLLFRATQDKFDIRVNIGVGRLDSILDKTSNALAFNTAMPGYRTVFQITPISA